MLQLGPAPTATSLVSIAAHDFRGPGATIFHGQLYPDRRSLTHRAPVMNAVTPITSHQSVTILPDPPPIVLRFAGLHPSDLGKFRMHDERRGGDLSHVDHDHSQKNRVEIGHSGWIEELRAEVAAASRANLENHVAALAAKSRKKQIEAVKETGLVDPWRRCRTGPLREGILTVNKSWFGGTGCEAWQMIGSRLSARMPSRS